MQYRERFASPVELMRAALDGRQAEIWTALPGRVLVYDPDDLTVIAQPTVRASVRGPDGTVTTVAISPLPDVPVVFPSAGGYTLTFPIAAGDECLLVFSSRCIDQWWLAGGVRDAIDARMHDLSDAFAIIGPRSRARPLAGISTTSVQLRSDDGTLVVDLDHGAGKVTIVAPTEVTITSPLVTMSGDLHVAGDVEVGGAVTATGDVTGEGTSLHTHVHSGVRSGDSNTGAPV